jgi:hypothetical protein
MTIEAVGALIQQGGAVALAIVVWVEVRSIRRAIEVLGERLERASVPRA